MIERVNADREAEQKETDSEMEKVDGGAMIKANGTDMLRGQGIALDSSRDLNQAAAIPVVLGPKDIFPKKKK